MKHLALPATEAVDDAVVTEVCQQLQFTPHEANWLAAYAAYRAAGSDPWTVTPHAFLPDMHDAQYDLYDTRKGTKPLKAIREIAGLLCCPLCGSQTTNSLDHLLPRAVYPEFSIMRANLVPACTHCNSSSKGNKHRGAVAPERFIHPYFDAFADKAIWRLRINPPYEAATFDAVPEPDLTADQTQITAYHLKNVLGVAFLTRMRTTWSTYPGEVQIDAAGIPITTATTVATIAKDLARCEIAEGVNGWKTAFLRGLQANPAAVAHVAARALAYP